jgi:plastocyanin
VATAWIPVQLTEYQIQMPDIISSGPQTLRITNAGKVNHNFAIEGNGVAQKLGNDLTRGDSADMTVNLKPGTYTVYCPVDKHRAKGMQRTITVQ